MNNLTITGTLKADAEVDGKYLYCTIIERREGRGSAAGKTFRNYVKVICYGTDMSPQLTAGSFVEASGEAGAEAYQTKSDQKWRACLVLRGMNCVRPALMGEERHVPSPATPPEPATETATSDDDVPF